MREYLNFLGFKRIELKDTLNVIETNNRDLAINGTLIYPIIATKVKNKVVLSCSKKYKNDLDVYCKDKEINNEKEIYELLENFAKKTFADFEIKTMYRMTKSMPNLIVDCREVQLVDETKKEYFYNIIKRSTEEEYKKSKWKEFNFKKAPYRNQFWYDKVGFEIISKEVVLCIK